MNKVMLVGRLSQDPTSFVTASSVPYTRITIAVKRQNNDIADFISTIAWRNTALFADKYLKKGMLVSITGSLTVSRYQDKNMNYVTSTDVTIETINILESKKQVEEREKTFTPNTNISQTNNRNLSNNIDLDKPIQSNNVDTNKTETNWDFQISELDDIL